MLQLLTMKIKINEVFKGIQGEGKFAGTPMLFVRLSGCSRACSWCDTKYHIDGKFIDTFELVKQIKKSKCKIVCWTGGEPLIQRKAIKEIREILEPYNIQHHIETNGDLLEYNDIVSFHYLAISPKELKVAKKVSSLIKKSKIKDLDYDIKVVYDGAKIGSDMLKYATMFMPFTTYNKEKDLKIMKKVWLSALETNKKFSPRLQYFVFGKKKGI